MPRIVINEISSSYPAGWGQSRQTANGAVLEQLDCLHQNLLGPLTSVALLLSTIENLTASALPGQANRYLLLPPSFLAREQ